MIFILMQVKLIFMRKVLRLASFESESFLTRSWLILETCRMCNLGLGRTGKFAKAKQSTSEPMLSFAV